MLPSKPAAGPCWTSTARKRAVWSSRSSSPSASWWAAAPCASAPRCRPCASSPAAMACPPLPSLKRMTAWSTSVCCHRGAAPAISSRATISPPRRTRRSLPTPLPALPPSTPSRRTCIRAYPMRCQWGPAGCRPRCMARRPCSMPCARPCAFPPAACAAMATRWVFPRCASTWRQACPKTCSRSSRTRSC